jgi:hypothetical protein
MTSVRLEGSSSTPLGVDISFFRGAGGRGHAGAATGGQRVMPNNLLTNTAVVVGSTGIVGRAIAAKLAEIGG